MPDSSTMGPKPVLQDLRDRLVRHPPHERLRAGLLGAAAVWLWVFISDWVSGSPLRTSTFLGHSLLSVTGANAPTWGAVLAFTIVHCGLWTLVATLLLAAVHTASRTPQVLMFVLVVFILFQLAAVAYSMALSQGPLGALAWRSIFVGNAIGWLTTMWYILRQHPELRTELAHVDD